MMFLSYYCRISFKTIEPDQIFSFFQTIKSEINANLDKIAKNYAFNCPSQRHEPYFEKLPRSIKSEMNLNWAKRCFSYRYFYIPEHKLLGMFGMDDETDHLFDNITEFQNSCDRDYEFETWKNIEIFQNIAQKWINVDTDTIEQQYKAIYNSDFREEYDSEDYDINETIEYYRRTFAYDEIWNMFETYLYNDDKIVFLSLFSEFERHILSAFVKNCEQCAEEKLKDIKSTVIHHNMKGNDTMTFITKEIFNSKFDETSGDVAIITHRDSISGKTETTFFECDDAIYAKRVMFMPSNLDTQAGINDSETVYYRAGELDMAKFVKNVITDKTDKNRTCKMSMRMASKYIPNEYLVDTEIMEHVEFNV